MKIDKRTQLENNFQQIQAKISLLERIGQELTTLYEPGFETEIAELKKELKNLDEVELTAARFGLLKSKIKAIRERRTEMANEQRRAAEARQKAAEEQQREAEAAAFRQGGVEVKQKILAAEHLLQALNKKAQLAGENERLKVLTFLWSEVEAFNDHFNEGRFSLEVAIKNINELYGKVKIMAAEPDPPETSNDYYGYYKVLDVARTASGEEVKRAYRELIQINHPDRLVGQNVTPGVIKKATQKTAEINEAYEILGDPVKRKSYDSGTYKK